jgi:hypothetical protein
MNNLNLGNPTANEIKKRFTKNQGHSENNV